MSTTKTATEHDLFEPPETGEVGVLRNTRNSNNSAWIWQPEFDPMKITPGVDLVGTFRECWLELQARFNLPRGISCLRQCDTQPSHFTQYAKPSEYQILAWREPLSEADKSNLVDVISSVNYPIYITPATEPTAIAKRYDRGSYYGVRHDDIIKAGVFYGASNSSDGVSIDGHNIPKKLWQKVLATLPADCAWVAMLRGARSWFWYQPELAAYCREQAEVRAKQNERRQQKEKQKSETLITILSDVNVWTTDMERIYNNVTNGYTIGSPASYSDTDFDHWPQILGRFQLISKPRAYRHLVTFQNMLRKLKKSPKQPTLERDRYKRFWGWLQAEPIPRKFREVPREELIDWKRLEKFWPGSKIKYRDKANTVPYQLDFEDYPQIRVKT